MPDYGTREHSITFGDKNTWDDWHLVPKKRPSFNMPKFKTHIIDIPGADGVIDLSTALTGFPTFGNREGSWEFMVLNGYGEWYDRYSEIASYLHGQKFRAVLEDDLAFYYEGRFEVGDYKSEKDWSTLEIKYNVDPYKRTRQTTSEPWIWDPFNFQNGIIQDQYFRDLEINSPNTYESHDYTQYVGRMPVTPTFESTGAIDILFSNQELNISNYHLQVDGSSTDTNVIFSNYSPNNTVTLQFKGQGRLSIDFTIGRL